MNESYLYVLIALADKESQEGGWRVVRMMLQLAISPGLAPLLSKRTIIPSAALVTKGMRAASQGSELEMSKSFWNCFSFISSGESGRSPCSVAQGRRFASMAICKVDFPALSLAFTSAPFWIKSLRQKSRIQTL
jgi:hypothetical protein